MGVRVYPFSYALARPGNLLSNILFCLLRNAQSRALRTLETPEEKLVRRAIRNEKDRAKRRRAKTKQKQVAK